MTRSPIPAKSHPATQTAPSGSWIRPRLRASVPSAALYLLLAGCSEPRIDPPRPPPLLQLAPNTLLFAGDVMFCRAVRRQMLARHDPALPFRAVAAQLAAADITFLNLESPFSDRGRYFEDGLIFHASPDAIAGLQLAGVDIVSTANNHARDTGAHGVEFTIAWLRAHGIAPLGSAETPASTHAGVVIERHGVRFGFLGYTFDQQNGNWRDIDSRIALTDPEVLKQDVASLSKRADVVIVSMHAGVEYQARPNAAQVRFAHAAIDAGAKLVIGHHPHVVQPEERYRGGLIFYSLGNFVFDQFQREATQHGELVEAQFCGTRMIAAQSLQVRIGHDGPEFE